MANPFSGKTTTAVKKLQGALMWVGPEITYLRQGNAFNFDSEEPPKFLQRYINECPSVAVLLVPAADYLFAQKEVLRTGSKLWAAANAVNKYFNSGGKT